MGLDVRDVLVELRLRVAQAYAYKTTTQATDLHNFWNGEIHGLTEAIKLLEKLDVRE